jgi:predicted Rossmann fold nucleotide-binding protein DprA/Smf involved in DNA uptake
MTEKKAELRVAVIGSRSIDYADLSRYIPEEATALISGGAVGVDTLAEAYAKEKGLPIRIIKPQYEIFGRKAPLLRDRQIVECADLVIAIWDGESTGTAYTIDYAHEKGVPVRLYIPPANNGKNKV